MRTADGLSTASRSAAADGIFRLKMAGVDEVEAKIRRIGKLVVFEVCRDQRIAAVRQHCVDGAAARAAAPICFSSTMISSTYRGQTPF